MSARSFSNLGKKYFVEVDYSILIDSMRELTGECSGDLVGKYDDCAEEKVRFLHT